MTLNDIEFQIIVTRAMGLKEKNALEYLKTKGMEISHATYWRTWGALRVKYEERAFEIAKQFPQIHINRLDLFYTLRQEMWTQYKEEDDPLKKTLILERIARLEPYISSLEEYTKDIIEHGATKEPTGTQAILSQLPEEQGKAAGN